MVFRGTLIALGATHPRALPARRPECPMRDDWCHFAVRLPRSAAHRAAKGAKRGFEDEKFTYVVAVRDGRSGSRRPGSSGTRWCARATSVSGCAIRPAPARAYGRPQRSGLPNGPASSRGAIASRSSGRRQAQQPQSSPRQPLTPSADGDDADHGGGRRIRPPPAERARSRRGRRAARPRGTRRSCSARPRGGRPTCRAPPDARFAIASSGIVGAVRPRGRSRPSSTPGWSPREQSERPTRPRRTRRARSR